MEIFVFLSFLFSLSTTSCHIIPVTSQNDIASKMTLMEQTITTLQTRMTASDNELASMKTKQLLTESELASVKTKQSSTETELASVKSAMQSQLLAADAELTTVKFRLQTTESELITVKTQLAKSPDPNEYKQMKADLALLRVQYTAHLNATVVDRIGSDVSSNRNNIQILNASCNSLHNSISNINVSAEKNSVDISGLKTELTKVKSLDTDVNASKTLCQMTVSDIKSLNFNVSQLFGKVSNIQNSLLNITGSRTRISFEVRQMDNNVTFGDSDILKFDTVTLNTGNAYNPQTGIFTVPVDGTYLFWVHVKGRDNMWFDIALQREDQEIARGFTGDRVHQGTATIIHVVKLKKGDKINIINLQHGEPTRLFGLGFSNYGGTLLYV